MNSKQHGPFLWIALSFALGIALAFKAGSGVWWILAPAMPAALIFYFYTRRHLSRKADWFFWASTALSFTALGSGFFLLSDQKAADDISVVSGQTVTVRGYALRNGKMGEKGQNVWMKVEEVETEKGKWQAASGSLMVFMPVEVPQVEGYAQLSFSAKIQPLKGDWAAPGAWAWRNRISGNAYAKSVKITGRYDGIAARLFHWRENLEAEFRTQMGNPQMAELSIAMLLGDRGALDTDLSRDFAVSGASHLISVSGLHVVVIYEFLLLMFMLGPLKHLPMQVRLGAAIGLLIAYALFTGACPPVVRAVFMLSLVALSRMASLRVQTANLLGFTAFVMLLWDPFLLFDIGFQLSFIAVLGLIVAGNKFSSLSERMMPRIPAFVHRINGASVAAQLFTLPFIVLYFGQFPTYFLLVNLLIIPIADFAIKVGMLASVLAFVPGVSTALFFLLNLMMAAVTAVCSFFASLPGALTRHISINDAGFVALMGFGVIALGLWFRSQERAKKNGENWGGLAPADSGNTYN